ncbi:zinc-binding dehydrogenase [Candidatus Pacearchaeota archaeon]|nr:zinc-binding dehydrogenase [Candidatus Pacearchaeota archaeon]
MKAAQLIKPRNFEVIETDKAPGSLKVLFVGLCGSDITYYKGDGDYPKPIGFPGHEILGRTEDGKLVVVDSGNGFQEYLPVPPHGTLVPIPEPDSNIPRMTLTQPLACVLQAISRIDLVMQTKWNSVMILGQGAIGLLFSAAYKHLSPDMTIITVEPLPGRSQLSRSMSAHRHRAYNLPAKAMKYSGETLSDIVIEASGSTEAIQQAPSLAKKCVMYFGGPHQHHISFPTRSFFSTDKILLSSHGSSRIYIELAAKLIAKNSIDVLPIVSGIYPGLEALNIGFDDFVDNPNKYVKVLIHVES